MNEKQEIRLNIYPEGEKTAYNAYSNKKDGVETFIVGLLCKARIVEDGFYGGGQKCHGLFKYVIDTST